MKTSRLLFSLMVVVTLGGDVRAADVVNNWSFLEPGVLPKVSNFAASGIPIYIAGLKGGGVVDAKSTPANPFSGATRALFVEPAPDKGVLRIFTRPFPDKTPAKPGTGSKARSSSLVLPSSLNPPLSLALPSRAS
jgi:hypothetical protein